MLDLSLEVRPFPGDTAVAIFSGDIYTEQAGNEVLQFHRRHSNDLTLMLNPVPDSMKGEFGTVLLGEGNRIVEFREKDPTSPSNLNNSSRYLVRLDLLERYRHRLTPVPVDKARHKDPGLFFDFGMHLFPLLQREGARFAGFVSEQEWADLGRVDDYLEVQLRLMQRNGVRSIEAGARVDPAVRLAGPYLVEEQAQVTGTSLLDNAHVGRGWQVQGSVLERVVLLPLPATVSYTVESSSLKDCVVACGTLAGQQLRGRLIVSDGSRLVDKQIQTG
ncbi:MAG: NDP-sugar synthase [Deltaproteobacteria bacterium]|nr:NDP-sugar synthase [Deltaproteobacteria bacterium]